MGGLALAMFVALFGFGSELLGWDDSNGNIRIALVASLCFGIILGWKTKN